MIHHNIKWLMAAAAAAALAAAGGCDDHATTTPATQAPAQNVNFSTFANQAFSNAANSTPVAVNGVAFIFDVDTQPTYFNGLITMGTFQ